jgi:hypothetical protein
VGLIFSDNEIVNFSGEGAEYSLFEPVFLSIEPCESRFSKREKFGLLASGSTNWPLDECLIHKI